MSQNIFSLEGLISWLETKPPETTYEYTDSRRCLITTYLRERGLPVMSCVCIWWRDHNGQSHESVGMQLLSSAANHQPYTYGATLQRARELLNATPSNR